MVLITPLAEIWRITLLAVSAIYTLPERIHRHGFGRVQLRGRRGRRRPSTEHAAAAMVEMVVPVTLRMRLLSESR